jgi:PAS domain S-box-containing protein
MDFALSSELTLLQGIASLEGISWLVLDRRHDHILKSSENFKEILQISSDRPNCFTSFLDLLNFVYEEDRKYIAEEVVQAVRHRKIYDLEYRLANNEHRWVSQKGYVLSDLSLCDSWLITLSDVTDRRIAQEAAINIECRWKSLVQHSSEVILILGNDFRMYQITPNSKQILGHHYFSLINHHFLDFVYSDDVNKVIPALQDWFRGIDCSTEFRLPRNESLIYISAFGSKISDSESLQEVVVTLRDVTEQKQTEELLWRQREQIAAIVHNVPGAVFRCKVDEFWTETYVSDQVKELTGFAASDFLTNSEVYNFENLILPSYRQQVRKTVMEALLDRQPYSIEYPLNHQDGTIRWALEKGQGAFGLNGEVEWLDGVIIDITERRNLENKLEETINELNFHFENTPLAVVKWNDSFQITHWSSQAEIMFELSAEDVVGKFLDELKFVVEADADRVQTVIQKLQSGEEKRNRCCNRNYTKSGEIIHCEWYNSAQWSKDSNELQSVFSLVLNVTDRFNASSKLENTISSLEAIIASTADGILTLATDGKIQHYNEKFVSLWEIPAKVLASGDDKVLVAFQINKILNPEKFVKLVQSELEDPNLKSQELIYLNDGLILERYSVPQYVNHLVSGRVVSYRDMTLLSQTQNSLSSQVQQWESLVSNLPGAVFRHALDEHWTVQYVSDAIETITGYPASDYVENYKRTFASDDHPEDRERVRKAVEKSARTRQPYSLEYRIIHRDGSIRWVWEKGRVVDGNTDQALYIDGILFDVTERKN